MRENKGTLENPKGTITFPHAKQLITINLTLLLKEGRFSLSKIDLVHVQSVSALPCVFSANKGMTHAWNTVLSQSQCTSER